MKTESSPARHRRKRRVGAAVGGKKKDCETLSGGDLETGSAAVSREAGSLSGVGVEKSDEAGKKKPKGVKKRKRAKKPRQRSWTPEEVLAGMRPEEIEEIQALLGREQSAADFKKVDVEKFNHALLVFFQRAIAVMHLRPFQVEERTRVTHQHQLKLHPHANAHEDVHVNLCVVGQLCNGLHLGVMRVLEYIWRKIMPLLPLLTPLET